MRFPTQNAEKKENLLPTKGLGKNGISDLGEKDTFLLAASGGLEDGWGGGSKKCFSVTRYGKKEWSVSSSSSSSSPGNSKPWNGRKKEKEREKFARFAKKPGIVIFCNTTKERKGNKWKDFQCSDPLPLLMRYIYYAIRGFFGVTYKSKSVTESILLSPPRKAR